MVQAEAENNNLLRVSYTGKILAEDMQRASEELTALLAGIKPGFQLLVDLSGLELMDLACMPYLRRMMDLLNKKGIALVVRVIPDPRKDIGLNILSLFHYHRRVKIVTCETLAEARQALG